MRCGSGEKEYQVWFITIDDDEIAKEADVHKRKELLLERFGEWHDPISHLVLSTPAEAILKDEALAHKHSLGPLLPHQDKGTLLVFVGDAYMTVDPILAQGFTMGMEAGQSLAERLATLNGVEDLGSALRRRHEERLRRLICLLRATELVQALGQPQSSSLWNTHFVRPLTRVVPNLVKRPLFDRILKYSVGQ